MSARANALHDRVWAARARLSVDHHTGRPVDQRNITAALLSCGCTVCRSQVRQIAVELHRVGALP